MRSFIKEVVETLDFLSKQGVVHCDLKPDNILIRIDVGKIEIKLIDFGSSIDYSTPSNFGMITPEYMPPEVLKISESLF